MTVSSTIFVTLKMFEDGGADVVVDCPRCLTSFNAALAESPSDPH